MIAADEANREVVMPYINGEDLNSRPAADGSRMVVNFFDWPVSKATKFHSPYRHIEQNVRPDRQRLKADGSFALRKPLPERWWQYADKRPGLYRSIADLDCVIALTLVSKTIMPTMVPARQVFSHALAVFASDDFADLSFLSSSIHAIWTIKYASTLGTGTRYTPSDVFETLARPLSTPRMREVGEKIDHDRREVMLRRQLGLTQLYNLVNHSDFESDAEARFLREIHVEIDNAVMEAYGWTDIPLAHGFHSYRNMERFTVSPAARVEILDRLLAENHRRAALEAGNGKGTPSVRGLDLDPGVAPEGAMF